MGMVRVGAEARGWPWAWAWVALQALALALWVRCLTVVDFDEAGQLAQAWRLVQGDRLYQEAWEFAAPLPLWAMAGLYAWTGPSLEVARNLTGACLVVLVLASCAVGRQLGARPFWAALGATGVAWGALAMNHFFYHQLGAWAFGMVGLWAGCQALGAGQVRPWLWALGGGLAWGLAGLCTAPMTLLALAAWVALAGWAWATGQWPLRGALAWVGWWLLGLALPWLGAWAVVAWQGDGWALWRQVWWWPYAHYKLRGSANDIRPLTDLPEWLYTFAKEPMAYPLWLGRFLARVGVALLGLATPVVVALGLVWAWVRGSGRGLALPGVWVALVAAGSMAIALRGRADLAHLLVASVPAWPTWARGAQSLWDQGASWRDESARWPALALVALVALSGVEAGRQWRQDLQEGRLAWRFDGRLQESPVMRALAPYRGRSIVAFPGFGLAPLLGGMRPATRFNVLTLRRWAYHGRAEYQDFAADWRASPPDVVLLMGLSGDEAVDQWGGVPSLKGYLHLGRFAGPYRRESWDMDLWVRDGLASSPPHPAAQIQD